MRSCVGCREIKPKKELVRIVRKSTSEVALDPSGRLSGRGVYLCPRESCLDTAIKKKRLSYNLKTNISEADLTRLGEEIREFIPVFEKAKRPNK